MLLLLMYEEVDYFLMFCSTTMPLCLMTSLKILRRHNLSFIIYDLRTADIKWSVGFSLRFFILTQVHSWDHRGIMHLGEDANLCWCFGTYQKKGICLVSRVRFQIICTLEVSKLLPGNLKEFCKYWRAYVYNILWKKRLNIEEKQINYLIDI